VGLFYLALGDARLTSCALKACAKVFSLPEEAKKSMDVSNSPHWRGYMELGCENTQGKADWREQVFIFICAYIYMYIHMAGAGA
jgi:isopenicillin N synthase-like dioxygenase